MLDRKKSVERNRISNGMHCRCGMIQVDSTPAPTPAPAAHPGSSSSRLLLALRSRSSWRRSRKMMPRSLDLGGKSATMG